jgi:parallel beta-helix repeat protein
MARASRGNVAKGKTQIFPETYGAVGDGVTNDNAALLSAIAACGATSTVWLSATKSYRHTTVLSLTNAGSSISGPGNLHSTVPSNAAIKLTANNTGVERITTTSTATVRGSTLEEQRIALLGSGNFVRFVTVNGGATGGIFAYGASNFVIDNPTVLNTKADGIHMTNQSNNGVVLNPTCTNVGDDGVAVVSYESDGGRCHDIVVRTPHVYDNVTGRGISVIGGYNISYYDIDIDGTVAAGIIIAEEAGDFITYGCDDILVSGGTVKDACTTGSLDHGFLHMSTPLGGTINGIDSVIIENLAWSNRPAGTGATDWWGRVYGTITNGIIRNITATPSSADPIFQDDTVSGPNFTQTNLTYV